MDPRFIPKNHGADKPDGLSANKDLNPLTANQEIPLN